MSISLLAHQFVEKNDASGFRELLDTIDVSDLDDGQLEFMILLFLLPCYKFNKIYYCRDVISAFDYDEQLPILTRLFTFRSLPDKVLEFVISIYHDTKAFEHIDNLNEYKDNENYAYTLERIINLYPELLAQEYIQLYNSAIDNSNTSMIKLLENEIVKRNVFAPVPDWVIQPEPGTSLEIPEPPEFKFEMPSDTTAIKLLREAFGRVKVKGPEGGFEKTYKKRTEDQKRELMRDVFEQDRSDVLFNMKEYNKLIGPRHVETSGLYEDTDHQCYKYGGHAMLLCICNEDHEDSDEVAIDWFLGYCIRCKRRIRSRFHCLRRVILTGGWVGCFCSEDCAMDPSIKFEAELGKFDQTLLLDYLEILKRDGIYDRPETLLLPLPDYSSLKTEEIVDVVFDVVSEPADEFAVLELRKPDRELGKK